MKKVKGFIIACFLTFPFISNASHMMGAEITYKWLGNKKYEITTKIYRDCRGIPLNSPTITVSDYNGTNIALSYTRTKIEDITLVCSDSIKKPCYPANTTVSSFGIELHTFVGTIDFGASPYNAFPNNGSCKIYFIVEQCCRNGAITTLNQGNLYVEAMLDICNSKFQNTSPQFKSRNVMTAACNVPFRQNFGSKDFEDYDSLGYELINPLNGANSNEAYQGSFTPSIPMTPFCLPPGVINCKPLPNSSPPRGFYFDKLTGDVVFVPSKCDEVGVITMKVSEYRWDIANKKWLTIGYVTRDIQINVLVTSSFNNPPAVNMSSLYNFRTREKQCIDFPTKDSAASGSSSNNKGDKTFMAIRELPAGATFGYVDSSVKNKTGRFCWQVHDSIYLKFKNKNKLMPISMEIWDNFCNLPAYLQKSFNIKLLPPDSSGFLSINTFWDYNKNNKKDTHDFPFPVLLKFKDKNSAYYIDTDEKGKLNDSMGIGKINIGVAGHPYYYGVAKDTNLLVKMDSSHYLNFGITETHGIFGRIYEDANGNCKYDRGELPYSGYKVFTDSNKYIGISDKKGIYYINAPKGTYNLTCDFKPAEYMVNCPPSKTIKVTINGDSAYKGNDFGIDKNMNYMDISTGVSMARLRRGNNSYVTFYCINNGPKTRKNIKLYSPVNSNFDLNYKNSVYASAGSTAVIPIDSILPYKTFSITMDFMVSSTGFKSGDNLCFKVKTDSTNKALDSVTNNNSSEECRIVDAPYDPNEKLVAVDSSKTTIDKLIAYTIHFQNSGTDTATRIVVRDTIDTRYLDLAKFQMNWSDYPCEPIISGNTIHFIFDKINLPYFSKSSEQSSAGFNFTLGLKSAVNKETSFSNKAAIYFDFENPIFTKKAIATINSPMVLTGIKKANLCKNEMNKVYYRSKISFNPGNQLMLELSDVNGSFSAPTVLKTISSTFVNDSIDFTIPKSHNSAKYTLRLRSTNPQSVSIPINGNIDFNLLATPTFLTDLNIKNNIACEKDTLKMSMLSNSYLYKVVRNNISLSNFNTVKYYEFPIKAIDSFKIIALDNMTGCKDTLRIYPSIYKKPVVTASILNRKSQYCNGEQLDLSANGGLKYTYFSNNTILANNISNSTYKATLDIASVFQVKGEDINGCANLSDTMKVIVNPNPIATISTNPSPICATDSVMLVYGTALNYDLYKNNSLILSKTTAFSYKINQLVDGDKYKITAISDKGCSAISNELIIKINSIPAKPVISKNNNDLIVNYTGDIKWYRNGLLTGNTTNTINNAVSGIYKVIVTNIEGCSNTSSDFVHHNTGISELLNNSFRVYPNPAGKDLTIENMNAAVLFDIKLFDLNGRLVFESSGNISNKIIDISKFSPGLYTLQIEEKNGTAFTHKISIVR